MSEFSGALVANAADGTISTFRFKGNSLERIAVSGDLTGCSTFAVDRQRSVVYAAVKPSGSQEHAGIGTFAWDQQTGELTLRHRLDLPRGGMNYLALTSDGRGLLGAAYSGGYGITCTIDDDGALSEPVSSVEFANLHSVLPTSNDRFAYFVSLGDDLIGQYALADDMSLVPLEVETVAAPPGSGPRHLVIDEPREAVYVLTEFSGEVLRYHRDPGTGSLTLVASASAYDASTGITHSEFGADPVENHYIWGADLHASGDYLWASERTASTLAAVRITDSGALESAESFKVTETQPRGFDISPDGAYLLAAGEKSDSVSLYAIHGDRLELLDRVETGQGANWVRFV